MLRDSVAHAQCRWSSNNFDDLDSPRLWFHKQNFKRVIFSGPKQLNKKNVIS